jgi:hypothetical protein
MAVAERLEVDGFGPWTVKNGFVHVAPPFDLLAGMVTLRIHLDPVPATKCTASDRAGATPTLAMLDSAIDRQMEIATKRLP